VHKTELKSRKKNWLTIAGLFIVFFLLFSGFFALEGRASFDLERKREFSPQKTCPDFIEEMLGTLLYDYQKKQEEVTGDIKSEAEAPLFPFILESRALEDVDLLFRVLKYGYAGYEIYGGDQAFNQARQQIKGEIESSSSMPFISTTTLGKILRAGLSFIQDGHFQVEGQSLANHQLMHINEEYVFSRDQGKFFLEKEESFREVLAVNDQDPAYFIKPSLDEEGQLIYRLVDLYGKEGPLTLELKLKTGKEQVEEKEIELRPVNRVRQEGDDVQLEKVDDIPVLRSRTLQLTLEDDGYDPLMLQAQKFQEEPVAILDLRSNHGGFMELGRTWISLYTGANPSMNLITCVLRTKTARKLEIPGLEDREHFQEYWDMVQEHFPSPVGGWAVLPRKEFRPLPSENYLVVLVDNFTASAAEHFMRMLLQVENVIIIGTNTAGINTTGGVARLALPNSGISISLGTTLYLTGDFKIAEGRGYEPDIWVPGEETLEKSILFINRYLLPD